MIERLYPYLILVGLTIGAVMAVLWYKARRAGHMNLALIRLNEQCGFDAPSFLALGSSLLARSSIRGLRWQLDWFGVTSSGGAGLAQGRPTRRIASAGEMRAEVVFYQRERGGERRYFEQALIETCMLLLRMDMLIKAGAINASLSHMSRLNLFLQHDMKNIAQFIQLMADQLANVPEGKEQKVLDYLRFATPLVRHRADRVVRTLTLGAAPPAVPGSFALAALLAQLCGLYGLTCKIEGDATVTDEALEPVFDNILKNYHDLAMAQPQPGLVVEIGIDDTGPAVSVTIAAPAAPRAQALERLFEPFWSSTPAGLGIGLYQARHIIERLGGSLKAIQDREGPLRFVVMCPPTATHAHYQSAMSVVSKPV
jgi:signal transduction histidine kinase